MREMNERMMKVAVGKIEKEAIKLVSIEYLNYMIEHPGVYETIQWAVWHGTEETATIFNNYLSLLTTLIQSCSLQKKNQAAAWFFFVLKSFTPAVSCRYKARNIFPFVPAADRDRRAPD